MEDTKKLLEGEEREVCVSCGKETEYTKKESINPLYIEGAGQLCPTCYRLIYKEVS